MSFPRLIELELLTCHRLELECPPRRSTPRPAGAVLDKAISLRVFAEKTFMTLITAIEVVLNCFL